MATELQVKAPSFLAQERGEFDEAVANASSVSLLQQIKKQITKNLQSFSNDEKQSRKKAIDARIEQLSALAEARIDEFLVEKDTKHISERVDSLISGKVDDVDRISGKRWDTAGGEDNARAKRFEHFKQGDNVWCKAHGIGRYQGASSDTALVSIDGKTIEIDILLLHVIEVEEKYALLQPGISVLILNKNFGECGEVAKVEQNQLTIAEPIAERPQMSIKWNNAVLTRRNFFNNTQLYNRAHLITEGDEVEWAKGSGRVLSISPTVKIKWEYRDDAMEYCAEDLFKMKVAPKLVIQGFEPDKPQPEEAPVQEKVAVKTGQLQIPLFAIVEDLSTQSREQINKETVEEYARERKAGISLPPIIAFTDAIKFWIGDGWHRYFAEKSIESSHIYADVREGTQRDAVLYSVGANANHGLRRSNADKRKSVITLLKDEEWRQWSNREIGRRCGVDEAMVRKYRQELSADNPQTDRLVQRNGASYTQKTGNIGKSKEVFPRQAVISADCPNVDLRGKQVTVTCKPNATSYIVDAGNGQAPPPIDKKFIVELPKPVKPITSVQQENKAVAQSLGVPAGGLPEIVRNDGINPNYEKIAKLNAAVNDVVDGASTLTDAQTAKLLKVINLDMVSDGDLRALVRRINQTLISRNRAEAA